MSQRELRAKLGGAGLRLRSAIVAGTTAATNITVTGIKPGDQIAFAALATQYEDTSSGDIFDNVADEISITAANTVQLSTTNSTGSQLLLLWVSLEK